MNFFEENNSDPDRLNSRMCRSKRRISSAVAVALLVNAAACAPSTPEPTLTRQQAADRIEAGFQAVVAGMPGSTIEHYSVDHVYLPIDCTGEIGADKAVRLTRYDWFRPPATPDDPVAVINEIVDRWEADGWD